MENRRRIAGPFIVFFVGLVGIFDLTERPSFGAIRTVDVIQLVGSGMCFGVALLALILIVRGKIMA